MWEAVPKEFHSGYPVETLSRAFLLTALRAEEHVNSESAKRSGTGDINLCIIRNEKWF